MIHPQQVQDAVQHEDANLVQWRVTELARLPGGAAGGDGQITEHARTFEGERQHIGGVVMAQEAEVQAAQLAVVGDQAVELAAACDCVAQRSRELLERRAAQRGGGAAE